MARWLARWLTGVDGYSGVWLEGWLNGSEDDRQDSQLDGCELG